MVEAKECDDCGGNIVIETVGENQVPVCQGCGLIEEESQMAQYYQSFEEEEGVVEELHNARY